MFKQLTNGYRFRRAQSEAASTGGSVCATKDRKGEWRYFVMPADADEADVRAQAFQLREGRPMNRLEQQLNDFARREPTW